LRPLQECPFIELIAFCVGIADELSEEHCAELLSILALKHVALQLDFSLLRFVFGSGFGNRPSVLVVSEVVPPDFASFPNCQRASPPLAVAATAEVLSA